MKRVVKSVMQKLIVCAALVFGTLALAGTEVKADMALTGTCGDNVTYTLDKDTGVLTISGVGPMKNYSDYSITKPAMGTSPFSFKASSSLDAAEFSISSVVIESGVTSIGAYAFDTCYLKSITIPDSVTSVGAGAFEDCSRLESVTIPSGVTSIGARAFNGCSKLESVMIPDSVTSVGENAFAGTSYYTNDANWDNGILYSGNILIAANDSAFSGSCTIKAGTKFIADKAFSGSRKVKEIVIPDSVTSIGEYAFDNSYLEKVTLGKGVTSIGKGAFSMCPNLNMITIDKNVTSIGEDAFKSCGTFSIYGTIEISGYKGTAAESYAAANKHRFVALDVTEPDKQDADKTAADKKTTTTTDKKTATTKKEVIKGKAPKVSIKGKVKKLTIKYTASSKAIGFQVRYKKGSGKWLIKNYNTKKSVTKTISKLKKGKYSVQVRTYTSGKKSYSKWSKVKKVTVK